MEGGVSSKEFEEVEKKIKKKKWTVEEEEEDERETTELTALLKEQDREDYENAALDAKESEMMNPMFIGDPRRAKKEWLKAWTRTYDIPSASLSLFARFATLIPPCRGVTIAGDPKANEILIVGDIGREDIQFAIGHIVFLVENGRRIRTTFNTVEGYRMRVEEGDITLERLLILHIDPIEFAVEGNPRICSLT
jgi:hypothetical protein